VWLCAKYLKKLGTDFAENFRGEGRGPRYNRLDFGGDLLHDHHPDPGIFQKFFYIAIHAPYMTTLGGGMRCTDCSVALHCESNTIDL